MLPKPKDNHKYKDIFAEMMKDPRPNMMVPFPRKIPGSEEPYCELAIVVLTAEETTSITADAEKKTRAILKDNIAGKNEMSKGYDELFKSFCALGILHKSCMNPDDPTRPFFPNTTSIASVLSNDEVAILLNHYYTVSGLLGPVIGDLDEEESSWWMKTLEDGGKDPRFLLNSFSLEALKTLLMSMAGQLKSLRTDKSSSTSPHANTTIENT